MRETIDKVANTTLIAAVTGIGVAGVVGPMATAWATRRANRQQFERDQASKRRADLQALIDTAAELLGAGATNLRIAREAVAGGREEPEEIRDWGGKVHLLTQRLLTRLQPGHPVVQAYEEVRGTLEPVAGAASAETYLAALEDFEEARSRFLETARITLNAPLSDHLSG